MDTTHTTPQGRRRALTTEQARELARLSWAQAPTARARRIRTLKGRIAAGQQAQRELDALLKEAAPEPALEEPNVPQQGSGAVKQP